MRARRARPGRPSRARRPSSRRNGRPGAQVIDHLGREVYPYRRELVSTIIGRAEAHARLTGDRVTVIDREGRAVWSSE